jgi:hypothetical protein
MIRRVPHPSVLRVRFVRSAALRVCAYPDRNALVAQGARRCCGALGLLYRPMSRYTDSWAPFIAAPLPALDDSAGAVCAIRSAMDEYRRAQTFSLCTLCTLCRASGLRPFEQSALGGERISLQKFLSIDHQPRQLPLFRMQWQPFSFARASPARRAPLQGLSASEGSVFRQSEATARMRD